MALRKLRTMKKYNFHLFLGLLVLLFACKKQLIDANIAVENVEVSMIRSNGVDITYKLSSLGYQETGVMFSKKSNPNNPIYINALRENGVLKLTLQNLEPNTEYIYKVFYIQSNERKFGIKEYTVKTLVKEAEIFDLHVVNNVVNYEEDGSFTMYIDGENLNNLNLSELEIRLTNVQIFSFDYPILLQDNKYRFVLKDKVVQHDGPYIITATYRGVEILNQTVPFIYDGDRYWITFEQTNLPGYYTSSFNNELYYFYANKVHKWNGTQQRSVFISNVPYEGLQHDAIGLQYGNQLFFTIQMRVAWPNPNDISEVIYYPEAYAYEVSTNKWTAFSFMSQVYENANRMIKNARNFIFKDKLYLIYSLENQFPSSSGNDLNRKSYLYRYNKVNKQFESVANFDINIVHYSFVSIDDQLYLCGMVPVYDQGLIVSGTFAIYKVDDNFDMIEVYRGGTEKNPQIVFGNNVVAYDGKILIAASVNEFLLFDPNSKQLFPVYQKNHLGGFNFNGFFIYNNKVHVNPVSEKIHELSIHRGR